MENLEAQVLDVSKIQIIPSDTEIPVHDNPIQTKRPLCTNFPENSIILDKLEGINVTECGSDLFIKEYKVIDNIEDLKKYLSELIIRFDTDPKYLNKHDFQYLMTTIYKTLLHLYDVDVRALMVKEWLNPHSDKYIPTEKLVAETIEELNRKLDQEVLDRIQAVANEATLRLQGDQELSDFLNREVLRIEGLISDETSARQSADSNLQDNIDSEAGTRASEITRVEGLISTEELARQLADQNLQNTKQDNLTAGDNISITNNVISAVDTIYDDTEIKSDISNLEQNKQDNLIAGSNIQISGNTISATDTIYDDTEVRGLIDDVDQKVDNLDDFTCGTIVPTTTNFVEGTEYTIHEALQRTANLFEGYQGEIDDINELIPNQTTPQNQLADKAFVNSTVATNAANFRGNWNNYTSIPTNINDYPEDYSGNKTPTNNDYLVVQDGTDYGATYTGMWRFIYIGTWEVDGKLGWHPQYRVGSAFTAEQQAAIDSGITQSKVIKYDNYNNTIGTLQTDKLDKVYTTNKVYGTNNLGVQTVYTAGTGIAFENGYINSTIQDDLLPLIYAGL